MSLTLITGTPGAGKTAYGVEHFCATVPGSFIEAQDRCTSHGKTYDKGDQIPRHLFSNIKGLLVEHSHIDDDDLRTWHTWAQPGDVIVGDEVQSVWRPRGLGTKVPEEIQAIETHRHMGVDLVVITQHQMLLDQNIRRLVNRHLHVRRVNVFMTLVYEWDHCGEIGKYRTCIGRHGWRLKRSTFALYKSAQLHTKATQRSPVALLALLVLAAIGTAYMGPDVYARIADRAENAQADAKAKTKPVAQLVPAKTAVSAPAATQTPASVSAAGQVFEVAQVVLKPKLAGCVAVGSRCSCFDVEGGRAQVEPAACQEQLPQGGKPIEVDFAPELAAHQADQSQAGQDDQVRQFMASRLPEIRGGYDQVGIRILGTTR